MLNYVTVDVDEDMLWYLYESPSIVTDDIDETLRVILDVCPDLDETVIEAYEVSSDTLEDFFGLNAFDESKELYVIRLEDIECNNLISLIEMKGYKVTLFSQLIDENRENDESEEDYDF